MTEDQKERLKTLLLSGAVSGGVLGGAGSLLGGAKSFGSVGKAAALGAGLSAALAGGSGYLGEKVMPNPDPNDPAAFTNRGAVGGALAGGLLGAGAGALLGGKTGVSRALRKGIIDQVGRGVVARGLSKLKSPVAGAGILGGAGALIAGYQGADEGMQADYLNNLRQAEKKRILKEALQS